VDRPRSPTSPHTGLPESGFARRCPGTDLDVRNRQGTEFGSAPPERLARLAGLVFGKGQKDPIEGWKKQWKQGAASINPTWFPEDNPSFSVLQYDAITDDQLRAKVGQLPRGTQLRWQFWQPGQISPPMSLAKQEEVYERLRSVA